MVQIGNGTVVSCQGICRHVVVKLKSVDIDITKDIYPFELGNVDAVLGVKWLASLDTVQANWREMFLKFLLGGRWYKIQGETKPGVDAVSYHAMLKLVHKGEQPYLFQLSSPEESSEIVEHLEIATLLNRLDDVFHFKLGLPHKGRWTMRSQLWKRASRLD